MKELVLCLVIFFFQKRNIYISCAFKVYLNYIYMRKLRNFKYETECWVKFIGYRFLSIAGFFKSDPRNTLQEGIACSSYVLHTIS